MTYKGQEDEVGIKRNALKKIPQWNVMENSVWAISEFIFHSEMKVRRGGLAFLLQPWFFGSLIKQKEPCGAKMAYLSNFTYLREYK